MRMLEECPSYHLKTRWVGKAAVIYVELRCITDDKHIKAKPERPFVS